MRSYIKVTAAFLLGLMIVFSGLLLVASADVGNFNDYDSGGSDWGGSGSDWGDSGSDWDDSDSDWSYSSGGSSGFSAGLGGFSIPVIVILVVIYLVRNKIPQNARGNYTNSTRTNYPMPAVSPVVDMTQSIEAQMKTTDPDFSSQKFLSWAEEVFMTLQDAWTKRDWKMIRPFECEALFNKHSRQLDEYIRNNTINVVERICINQSMLVNYSTDNQYEYLTVYMKTRMNDYIINADTHQVVKGDKDRVFYTNYNLKFMRSIGVKTTVNSGKSTTNCPNCGAPTQITSSGECEYCNSVITTGNHDWVLSDLDSAQ